MGSDCELAFVNLLRQLDADNHASRIVERLESQHRAQAPLHLAMVLLHNVVQILAATNLHRIRVPEVELPVHSHAPQGAMARLVAIQGGAVWLPMMLQCLAKECLRRQISVTQLEAKIQRRQRRMMSPSNQRPANRGFRSVLRCAISHYRQFPWLSAPEPSDGCVATFKSGERTLGWVDQTPAHAATSPAPFRIMCMASYPWIVRRAAWNSREPCLAFTRRLIAR